MDLNNLIESSFGNSAWPNSGEAHLWNKEAQTKSCDMGNQLGGLFCGSEGGLDAGVCSAKEHWCHEGESQIANEPLKSQSEREVERHQESLIVGGGRETFVSLAMEEGPQTSLINCGFGDEDDRRVGT